MHHSFTLYSKMNLESVDKSKSQLVIVTGFLLIGLIFDWHILILVSVILGLGFIFVRPFGDLVLKGWFKLAEVLGWFTSRILLTLIYYLVLTPLAFGFRLTGNNPLRLKADPSDSVYVDRNHTYVKEDLSDPW